MIRITFLLILLVGVSFAPKLNEEHMEKISKQLTFEKISSQNILIIKNISGSISVEGYQGDQIGRAHV